VNPETFLDSLVNYEKTPGYDYDLDDFRKFLEYFNSPQDRLKNVIHIAGTKGKGSTAAIVSSCLSSSGYRVGLFTSPHLRRVNERIKINDKEISNRDLEKYIRRIKRYIKNKHRSTKCKKTYGARTFFEVLTVIAFLHFLKKKVDFPILEVGLGGRLDTTNVTVPMLSVITRIGYDHTPLLGTRLEQIAWEKAGIIKPHGHLITKYQRPTVARVIDRLARQRKSTITFAEEQHTITIIGQSLRGSRININGELGTFNAFFPLVGQHQIENLLLALAVLNELRKKGYKISRQSIQKGIRRTSLHGRFEIISKDPLVIFDCAHNRDSFEALERNLDSFHIKDFCTILGSSRDKDIQYCLTHIVPRARQVLLVKADNPRAIEPTDLYARVRKYHRRVMIASSVQKALEYLKGSGNRKTPIIITGSFYLWPL
jgi:dihydrofolate synthase/folylpolyglutamate synthase